MKKPIECPACGSVKICTTYHDNLDKEYEAGVIEPGSRVLSLKCWPCQSSSPPVKAVGVSVKKMRRIALEWWRSDWESQQ